MKRELDAALASFASGELSAQITLMKLMIASQDLTVVDHTVKPHPELQRLLEQNRAGCARICQMLAGEHDSPDAAATVELGVAHSRRLFDWSVSQSEEASVALYSLGNPELLAAATEEVVALFREWKLIGLDQRCLQIGCGIGRFEAALGPLMREAHGIDVSEKMIEAARRRCIRLANVVLGTTHGRDLSMYKASRFELVYAVDTFPYLIQAGMALVDRYFSEVARVLMPGGCFALLNFSYREDLAVDRRDIRELALRHQLAVEVDGDRPFKLWDGAAWRLRKSGSSSRI